MQNLFIKVFKSKKGVKTYTLVLNHNNKEYYLSFDKVLLLTLLDISMSQFDSLAEGNYKIK